MIFTKGDIVSYRGNEYNYQWREHAPAGVGTVMKESFHPEWVVVTFPDGAIFGYPERDLNYIGGLPTQSLNPEFDLEEIELAEKLVQS